MLGDSKTASDVNTWPVSLATALPGTVAAHNGGVHSQTVAGALTAMNAELAAFPADGGTVNYQYALLNWGVNDIAGGLPAEATWEANYLAIIDKIHAKAPNAKIYLTRPWYSGHDADAATLSGWIDTIVAARVYTFVGDDESSWFKPNVATYSTDGVHFDTAAGQSGKTTATKTAMGY